MIGLVLVTGLLTNYLIRMVSNIRTRHAITSVLDQELAREPSGVADVVGGWLHSTHRVGDKRYHP